MGGGWVLGEVYGWVSGAVKGCWDERKWGSVCIFWGFGVVGYRVGISYVRLLIIIKYTV